MKVFPATASILAMFVIISRAQDGFYWRDYMGDLPNDALPAGNDEAGNAVYVGQTVHKGLSVLSGTIRTDQKKIFYEYGAAEFSTNEDVKILCSTHPEQFLWVKTSRGRPTAALTMNKRLIPAGSDRSRPLVVGRTALVDDEIVVGKVLIINNVFDNIWVAKNGTGWAETSYEVLMYDPRISIQNTCD